MRERASCSGKAAGYRRRAEELRAVAAQLSLKDTRHQLLEAARHLEVLAADEERRETAPKPLAWG